MKNVCKQIGFIAIVTNYRRGVFAAMLVAILGLTFAAPAHSGGIVGRVLGGSSSTTATGGTEAKPGSLAANKWVAGSAASNANAVGDGGGAWYSFNVTKGKTYHVFWNDEDNSGGTADVKVAAYYRDGSEIFDVDNSSNNTESFTASASGTVKIKVYPYSRNDSGTFSVAYSASGTRPGGGSAGESGNANAGGGILSGLVGWFRSLGGGGGARSGGKPTPLSANATVKQAIAKVKAIEAYCDAHDTVNNTAMKSLTGQISFVLNLCDNPRTAHLWNEYRDDMVIGINGIIGELE